MIQVNLGCPKYCEGWTCVDIHPKEELVVEANVFDWLSDRQDSLIDHIYTKNMLEHLPDPGAFLSLCKEALKPGGTISVITDNAEFFPFYLPFSLDHTGIGAHSRDKYAMSQRCNETHHFMVFTKMHLKNLLEYAGFEVLLMKRITFGARLQAIGAKK